MKMKFVGFVIVMERKISCNETNYTFFFSTANNFLPSCFYGRYHPCKCSGSIKYIHQDCLNRWLQQTKKEKCDLCNHHYQFTAGEAF